jgi:hypothetical protein
MKSIATKLDVTYIAKHLSTRIPELAIQAKNTGAWTEAVYKALREYKDGRRGWEIYPDTVAKRGEYLCDFMLFEKGYGPRIACESQWWHSWGNPYGKLDWSFDKLRGVKADVKIFIYEGELKRCEKIYRSYLSDNALLSPNEAFLFLKFDEEFKASWWKPSRQGVHRADEIIFDAIALE